MEKESDYYSVVTRGAGGQKDVLKTREAGQYHEL